MARQKPKTSSRKKTTKRTPARKRATQRFVCPDCGFVAAHAMGLGRHRSARHGAVSKRSARKRTTPAQPQGWLTRQEAAAQAGVHYNTIRLWEQGGLIRTRKRSGARGSLLDAGDLTRLLSERGAPSSPGGGGDAAAVAALERRFEQLLDGLERLVASARTSTARRRPGRPLGSRNVPKPSQTRVSGRGRAKKATTKGRKPAKRAGRKRTARR